MKRALEADEAPTGQRRRMEGGVAEDDDANLDPVTLVKKLVAGVKAKMNENIKKRAMHAGEPEKFMESELALDEELEKATLLAVNPAQYPLAVSMGLPTMLVQLAATHENNDILCSVMSLLSELTDADIVTEDERALCLHEDLARLDILPTMLQGLTRLSGVSEDEKEGVLSLFSVLENLMEAQPQMFTSKDNLPVCTQLAAFFLRSLLKKKPLDDVKTYSGELLSTLLQISPTVCVAVATLRVDKTGLPAAVRKEDEIDGVHALCECLAKYVKNRDSVTEEETEYIKDIYDCLAATLLYEEGKDAFCKAQGVMLMFLLIRKEKKKKQGGGKARAVQHVLKHSSLKCLVHALQDNKEGCMAFVKHDGLGIVFSFLMMVLKGAAGEDQSNLEGHAVSIISDLLKHLEGDELMRCVAKFSENEYEKSDRIVELLEKAVSQLATYDKQYEIQKRMINEAFQLSDEQHELERLDNGYLAIRQLSIVIARLCVYDKRFMQHYGAQLKVHTLSLEDVLRSLKEAADEEPENKYLSDLHAKFSAKVHQDEI